MPINARRWFEKAKRHLSTAHLNADHNGFRDTTCYFAHQTAELALKAFLISHTIDFPKVHALPQLLSLCLTENKEFSRFTDDMAFLNGFYIEAKYPLDIPFDPSETDTGKALAIADALVEFVDKLL